MGIYPWLGRRSLGWDWALSYEEAGRDDPYGNFWLICGMSWRTASATNFRASSSLPRATGTLNRIKAPAVLRDVRPLTRIAQGGVFTPSVAEQIVLLEAMGREKDCARIDALRARL